MSHPISTQPSNLEELLALNQPTVNAMLNAWLRQRGTAVTPDADTFDLVEIGQHLENAVRLCVENKDTVTFRFVGPAVCDRLQSDPTGTNFLDQMGHMPFDGAATLHAGLAAPAGFHVVYRITYKSGRHAENQALYLPLISRTGACDHLLGMQTAGITLGYERENPAAISGRKLVTACWVDLGAGVPAMPLWG